MSKSIIIDFCVQINISRDFIIPKSTDSEGEEDGKAASSEVSKWRSSVVKNTNQSTSDRKIGTWGERKQEVVEFSDADSPPAPMMEGNSNSTENYIKKTLKIVCEKFAKSSMF